MRLKILWTYFPLPAYSKTFWERIIFSRLTIIYFTFSVLHFLVQLALQIRAFTINDHAFIIGNTLLAQQPNGAAQGLPFYSDSSLRLCRWVPLNLNLADGHCRVVWPQTKGNIIQQPPWEDNMNSSSLIITSSTIPSSVTGMPSVPTTTSVTFDQSTSTTGLASSTLNTQEETTFIAANPVPTAIATTTVTSFIPASVVGTSFVSSITTSPILGVGANSEINNGKSLDKGEESDEEPDDGNDGDDLFLRRGDTSRSLEDTKLDSVCFDALTYPLSILGNTKREDIVFIAFQFWVLGMSIVALLNESMPHIFASLLTHVMATAWGGFQLTNTANFRHQFATLITQGACAGIKSDLPISSAYWEARKAAEASSLALNALALMVSCFLSWKLFKLFGWQTFKRVGASLVINRMYKLVLILSIAIQLSLFFMAVTVSLWLDRLINNVIGDLATLRTVYLVIFSITLTLLVPWLMMGWFGARRELRIPMFIFLILCLGYLGGWGAMFISTTFRWTFTTWTFFSIIASISVALTVACLVLGIFCRMNFGKGLSRYLHAQSNLPGDEFGIVTPEYDGCNDEKVEFPSTEKPMPTFNATYGSGFPTRGHIFISNGPRFFNRPPQAGVPMELPPQALNRTPSERSASSYTSEKSSSWESYYIYSHSRENSLQHGQSKRWVIE